MRKDLGPWNRITGPWLLLPVVISAPYPFPHACWLCDLDPNFPFFLNLNLFKWNPSSLLLSSSPPSSALPRHNVLVDAMITNRLTWTKHLPKQECSIWCDEWEKTSNHIVSMSVYIQCLMWSGKLFHVRTDLQPAILVKILIFYRRSLTRPWGLVAAKATIFGAGKILKVEENMLLSVKTTELPLSMWQVSFTFTTQESPCLYSYPIFYSDPVNPIIKGRLPTKTYTSIWRDAKVFNNHAYIVSEATSHGVQVFDLTLLRKEGTNQIFTESGYYSATGRCHNIAINEETGTAFCVGSANVAKGGLYILDLNNDPKLPQFSAQFPDDGCKCGKR